eukprot:1001404-Lingulodinium_polyedra.AAC.1
MLTQMWVSLLFPTISVKQKDLLPAAGTFGFYPPRGLIFSGKLARNSMAMDLPRKGKDEQAVVGATAGCHQSSAVQTTVNQTLAQSGNQSIY